MPKTKGGGEERPFETARRKSDDDQRTRSSQAGHRISDRRRVSIRRAAAEHIADDKADSNDDQHPSQVSAAPSQASDPCDPARL